MSAVTPIAPVPGRPPAESASTQAKDAALLLYLALRSQADSSVTEIAARLGMSPHEGARRLRELKNLHLIEPDGTAVVALDPDTALLRLFDVYEARIKEQIDELAQLQQSAETLVHQYRPAVMRQNIEVEVEVLPKGTLTARVQALVAAARTGSWSMHPGPLPPTAVLDRSLAQDRALIDRGVQIRAIYARSAASGLAGRRYLTSLAAAGAEVRLAGQLPFDLVIFDSHTALLPGNPAVPRQSALVLRGSRLMPTYIATFEDMWLRADPFLPAASADDPDSSVAKHADVLRLLANGQTDEQIARRLGSSRRTVGRVVAEMMEQMGALSRFHLGTLVVAHKLVDVSDSTGSDDQRESPAKLL